MALINFSLIRRDPGGGAKDTPQYNRRFYQSQIDNTRKTASKIVPILVQLFEPKSVVDVGCGVGVWLNEFQKAGVTDTFGIDGPWVNEELLQISPHQFFQHDLTRPVVFDRKFDLALSLEVAEHLPSKCSETLVESLTGLSDVVVFSAAIPYQGGTNHVNEQWPEYWQSLFSRHNFQVLDVVRKRIWYDVEIIDVYSQNIMVYVSKNLSTLRSRMEEEDKKYEQPLSLVHPRVWESHANPKKVSPLFIAKSMPFAFVNAIIEIFSRFKRK